MKLKEKRIVAAKSFLMQKGLTSKFDVDGFLGNGGKVAYIFFRKFL